MKRIIPALAVLALGGCAATGPQVEAQKQAEMLAHAENVCIHVSAEKHIACLNKVVHHNSYWGKGVMVVAANDGTPRIVENIPSVDHQYNVGGDIIASGPTGSAR